MKVMVLVKATENSESGVMPTTQQLSDMAAFNEDLVTAGLLMQGEGLHPSSKAVRVTFTGNGRNVRHGPFGETGSLVAGFWIWRVKSMEEAVAWVMRCPDSMGEGTEIELRPILEADDFGEALTPELREREDRLRTRVEVEVPA